MSPTLAAPPLLGDVRLDHPPTCEPPVTLRALTVAGVGTALVNVAGSFLVFTGGQRLAENNVRELLDVHGRPLEIRGGIEVTEFQERSGPLWDELVSDRHGTLTDRAAVVVLLALALLLSTLLARRGARWARAVLTLTALLTLVPHLLIITDHAPAGVTAFSQAGLVCALVVALGCWLPSVERHARRPKTSR